MKPSKQFASLVVVATSLGAALSVAHAGPRPFDTVCASEQSGATLTASKCQYSVAPYGVVSRSVRDSADPYTDGKRAVNDPSDPYTDGKRAVGDPADPYTDGK